MSYPVLYGDLAYKLRRVYSKRFEIYHDGFENSEPTSDSDTVFDCVPEFYQNFL